MFRHITFNSQRSSVRTLVVLESRLRRSDIICCWGGEEFPLKATDSDRSQACIETALPHVE